ncbi:hypothetical protein [Pantoea piersonii]|uniref:hypothetical protein n=1 Tax=Pantoea piersonii TaxID=2364647 RepID=UPI002897BB64|nr:hypothetical protein [Pantoea piersonii]
MRKADTLSSVILRFLAHSLTTFGHWAAASATCFLKELVTASVRVAEKKAASIIRYDQTQATKPIPLWKSYLLTWQAFVYSRLMKEQILVSIM